MFLSNLLKRKVNRLEPVEIIPITIKLPDESLTGKKVITINQRIFIVSSKEIDLFDLPQIKKHKNLGVRIKLNTFFYDPALVIIADIPDQGTLIYQQDQRKDAGGELEWYFRDYILLHRNPKDLPETQGYSLERYFHDTLSFSLRTVLDKRELILRDNTCSECSVFRKIHINI